LKQSLVVFAIAVFTAPFVSAQSDTDQGQPGMILPSPSGPQGHGGQMEAWLGANPIVVSSGQLAIEFSDRGVQVEQQVRVVNLGQSTHVFGGEASFVRLPDGYRSFEAAVQQPSNDQRVIEIAAKGFQLGGSLPPGAMVVAWRFQLPLTGAQTRFSVTLPWEIMTFRVFAQALPGIRLHVDGMPKARPHTEQGFSLLTTEFERKQSDAPFHAITVRLTGIPGANRLRWVALMLSIVIVALGAIIAGRVKRRVYNGHRVRE
jgi:hypothetical protein